MKFRIIYEGIFFLQVILFSNNYLVMTEIVIILFFKKDLE